MVSRPHSYTFLHNEFRKLPKKVMKDLKLNSRPQPPPLPSTYPPPVHFSAVTETVDAMINNYVKANGDGMDKEMFKDAMYTKVQQSCVAAGEPVGVLAAQSVGEPSTQVSATMFNL